MANVEIAKTRSLPFRIDRNQKANLPEQVAEGFRQAIRSRYYRAGDVLPARGEIARELGVSERVPREAIAILARESYVCPRRGVGCVVLGAKETFWKGRVLVVQREGCEGSYCNAMLVSELRRRLSRAGYLYASVTVDLKRGGKSYDLEPLEDALRQPTNLVLAVFPSQQIAAFLEGRCDYLCFAGLGPASRTVGSSSSMAALKRLFEYGHAAGVRRVLFSGYGFYEPELNAFREAGFEVENLPVWPPDGVGYLEAIEQTALDVFYSRFKPGRSRPDLVYFADDYIARGGLTALLARSVRVPEDVRVVTFANKGFCPVFPVSLARIESDPVAVGACAAESVIARLEGRPLAKGVSDAYFVVGASLGPS